VVRQRGGAGSKGGAPKSSASAVPETALVAGLEEAVRIVEGRLEECLCENTPCSACCEGARIVGTLRARVEKIGR
jgi:hypothetical protein